MARGSTSVTFDVYEEAGNLAVSRDIGKPDAKVFETSRELPRTIDNLSSLDTITVVGQFFGSTAYVDAKKLSELFAAESDGVDLTIDLTDLGFASAFKCAPVSESACQVVYESGNVDWVSVQVQVTLIEDTL